MGCRKGRLAMAAMLGGLLARPVEAQLGCSGATCTVEVTLPINDVLRLAVNAGSVSLGTPTPTDFTNGHKDVIGPAATVTVKANRAFQVQLVGAAATFAYTGALANPSKPASDLMWATSQAGLSSSATPITTGSVLVNQGTGASVQVPIYFRTYWTFLRDVPGTYSTAIRFTLSAP